MEYRLVDASVVEHSVRTVLAEARKLIEEAAGLARAAHACAEAGRPDTGAEIASDIDGLVRDAGRLFCLGAMLARTANGATASRLEGSAPTFVALPDIDAEAPPTDRVLAKATVKAFLGQARSRLDRAVGLARAAEICSEIGQAEEAVRVSLDIEPLLYDVKHLVNACGILNRQPEV